MIRNIIFESKEFVSGFFWYLTAILVRIPINWIRLIWCNIFFRKIGKKSYIGIGVDIRTPRNISIGSYTSINPRVLLDGRGGKLEIGNNVDIAQDARIWTLQHDYDSPSYAAIGKDVKIEDYAWIGAGATILPGVRIGRGSVVGTMSVVTKDVEDYTIVAGVPARKIGERNSNLHYRLGRRMWFR